MKGRCYICGEHTLVSRILNVKYSSQRCSECLIQPENKSHAKVKPDTIKEH